MKLAIFKETAERLPVSRLKKLMELVIDEEGDPDWPATVNLIVTDNRRIRQLNQQYRDIDKATDVLSFNIDRPEQRDGIFGEIYVSAPYVRRQVEECEHGLWDEYLLLFCHGLLHLLGYDHASKEDERDMFGRQQYYLNQLMEQV
jgi:probable rRNA maturation factor